MGNCLHRESSTQWGGDDWGSTASGRHSTQDNVADMEEEGDKIKLASSDLKGSRTEVKIKLTKKQLEELLAKADIKQLTVQQVLAQLVNVGDDISETHDQKSTSWRPNLRSIPE